MIVSCRDCAETTELINFTSPVRPLAERGWKVVNLRVDRMRQKFLLQCVCPECVRKIRRQGHYVNGHSR